MPTIKKQELSGGADGIGVKVVATSSPGTDVHTANATTDVNEYDEIWLWASTKNAAAVVLTIQFGATTAVTNDIAYTIQPNETVLVCPGLILQNSLVVKAYASVANVVSLHGYVNRID